MIRYLRKRWFGDRSQIAPAITQRQRSGDAGSGSPIPTLATDAVTALGQLELIARNAVDGVMSGKHRSNHRGGTSDFAEHRPYTSGDDIRRIDWRLHARNDRYHVRTYEDETNLRALIVVDVSGSMGYTGKFASKFDYARSLAGCMARLLMRQRDSVGLAIIDTTIRNEVPAGLRPSTLRRIQTTLAEAEVAGGSDLPTSLKQLNASGRRRGMMILISDCFTNSDELRKSLSEWSASGHDVLVVEILAPEELHFEFRGPMVFEDLEAPGTQMEIDAGNIRGVYLEQFTRHRAAVADAIRRSRASHFVLTTDSTIDTALREFLIRRAAMLDAAARSGGRRR